MIRRIRQKPQRKYFTSRELKKYIPVFDSGRIRLDGEPAEEYLQDIIFNQTTSLYEDAKGNMTPVLVDVPVAKFSIANSDYITLTNEIRIENGDTLEFWIKPTSVVGVGGDQTFISNILLTPTRASKLAFHTSNPNVINLYCQYTDESGYQITSLTFSTAFTTNATKIRLTIVGNGVTVKRFDTNESVSYTFTKPVYFSIKQLGTINGGQLFGGSILGIKKNGVTIASLQEFSGSKIFSPEGAVIGTWSGTGSRYARVSGIPSPHQAADIKRVSHAGGTAYVPATVSDATINANFTTVRLIETLSGLYKDDGSRMNLHPTTSNLVVSEGDEKITNGDFSQGTTGWTFGTNWSIINEQAYGNNTAHALTPNGVTLVSGKNYQLKLSYNSTAGQLYYKKGSTYVGLGIVSKEIDLIFTADGTSFIFSGSTFTGTVDNVSLKEVTTLSYYINSLETSSGIDLNTYEAGQLLPAAYNYALKDKPAGITQDLVGVFNGSAFLTIPAITINDGDSFTFWMKPNAIPAASIQVIFGGRQDTPTRISRIALSTTNAKRFDVSYYYADDSGYNAGSMDFLTNLSTNWCKYRVRISGNLIYIKRFDTNEEISRNCGVPIKFRFTSIGDTGTNVYRFVGMLSDVNFDDRAIYPLNGNVIDTVSGLPATNTGVTFTSVNETTSLIKLIKP